MRAADGSAADDGSAAAEVDLWGSPIPAVTGGGLGFFIYLAILFYFAAAAAAKICSNRGSSSSARQGKRDKYHYEVECVTDVPIGCILNR